MHILAGGTPRIDLMTCNVERPDRLVDVSHPRGLDGIQVTDIMIRIGALAKTSVVTDHPDVIAAAPVLPESLWKATLAQLRDMATIGSNLMQRTRCGYFRGPAVHPASNTRRPGSGCAATGGTNRNLAVLGVSDRCIATYSGDAAVAPVAFDAQIVLQGDVERRIPVHVFLPLPASTPGRKHPLVPGEMIATLEIPRSAALARSHDLKVCGQASHEFAVVGLQLKADGVTCGSRLARSPRNPGAHRPSSWLCVASIWTRPLLRTAAILAVTGEQPGGHNDLKIALAPKVAALALMHVGQIA